MNQLDDVPFGQREDYGVPTGAVPRVAHPLRQLVLKPVDPIQQAVDDYLLMERKARAWDILRRESSRSEQSALDLLLAKVHPAHKPSTS